MYYSVYDKERSRVLSAESVLSKEGGSEVVVLGPRDEEADCRFEGSPVSWRFGREFLNDLYDLSEHVGPVKLHNGWTVEAGYSRVHSDLCPVQALLPVLRVRTHGEDLFIDLFTGEEEVRWEPLFGWKSADWVHN